MGLEVTQAEIDDFLNAMRRYLTALQRQNAAILAILAKEPPKQSKGGTDL
jgi:hypothetical protein